MPISWGFNVLELTVYACVLQKCEVYSKRPRNGGHLGAVFFIKIKSISLTTGHIISDGWRGAV